MEIENKQGNNNPGKNKIRRVFVHSHSIFFILFLIGVTLDLFFPVTIFSNALIIPIGFLFLICGTSFIFWAEGSSHNFTGGSFTKENFLSGPYRYTRNPTLWGLFFLVIGFGFITNAFFVILCAIVSFLVEKFIFQEKAEKILEIKYGTPYVEYKKSVRF